MPAQSKKIYGLQSPRESFCVQVRNAKMCRSRLWVLGKDTIGENTIGRIVKNQMVLLVAEASFAPNSDRTFKAEYIWDKVVFSFDVFATNEII